MKFTKPTIIALAGVPTAVSSWSFGHIVPNYSVPMMFESIIPVERVLEKQLMANSLFDQQIGQSSQRYELIDNDEKFQLTVDVPGIKKEDIGIKIDAGQLIIRGQRVATTESTSESSRFTYKFFQSFSLDPTVDVDKFTATLKHGVLVVSAPKDLAKLEENVRRIPITHDTSDEEKKEIDAPVAPDDNDKKK